MGYDFEVSDILPGTPDDIYAAWMSSAGHSAMTGAEAHVDARVGGVFDAWDGYITGRTLALEPGGWQESYFAPMHEYFGRRRSR